MTPVRAGAGGQRRLADLDAGDVGDRVQRAGRAVERDAEVACARFGLRARRRRVSSSASSSGIHARAIASTALFDGFGSSAIAFERALRVGGGPSASIAVAASASIAASCSLAEPGRSPRLAGRLRAPSSTAGRRAPSSWPCPRWRLRPLFGRATRRSPSRQMRPPSAIRPFSSAPTPSKPSAPLVGFFRSAPPFVRHISREASPSARRASRAPAPAAGRGSRARIRPARKSYRTPRSERSSSRSRCTRPFRTCCFHAA